MKLTDLSIDGFGVWSGLHLNELSSGLNVFYGPNEAGKTTLMHFVRSVFFGFSPERSQRYLPPLDGGRAGGSIHLAATESSYVIARYAGGEHAGSVVVTRDSRQVVDDQQTLSALLGEVDEATFNNVFVFGLDEIQELATLGDTRAAEELYSLALGLDRVSLADVLKELDNSRERLLATDDRPSLIGQLLGQRRQLQGEIAELQQTSTRYLGLAAERERLADEIAALGAEDDRWDRQARRIGLARALSERWHRRELLGQRLESLGPADAFPADGLERFDTIESQLALCHKRMRKLKRTRSKLRGQIAELKINEALRRHALRVEALAEQQPWISALQKQILELENDLLELEAEGEETREQWGTGGKSTAALSSQAIEELRRAARDMQRARREAKALHEHAATAESAAEEVRRRVDSAMSGNKTGNLTEALAEAGELVSMLRKRVQLDERIGQMTARETELEAQGQEHLENQMLPTWALAGLGSLFVLGCALVLLFLVGMFLPGTLGDSVGSPIVALIGLAAIGTSAALKVGMDRRAESRIDKCHQQLSALNAQIKDAKAERDELDELLPSGGGPLVSRLQAAEKSLARLEELLPLQGESESATADVENTRRQMAKLRDRCRDTRARYRRLLAEYGLPQDLPPKRLKEFAHGRQQVAGLDASIADKKSELARRQIEFDSLVSRIKHLVSQVGVAPRSDKPLEQLQQCVSELAEQKSLVKQRSELARQIARLKPRWLKVVRSRNRLRKQRKNLLRSAGTLDEAEFRRMAALQNDALRVRGEHAALEREIAAALHGDENQIVAHWLAGGENLDALELHAQEAHRAASARLSEATERRGELNHQLKLLAEDRSLADKQLELEIVQQKLADAFERWRVLATCNLLLAAVREYYEREHQPQVLREASAYLKRLTGGRYTRVWTPLGKHELRIDEQQGRSLGVEVLSSGTREQLFLALRLALVASFARRGIELPLVLDDVLVNFDVGRARAAAVVLRDFAKRGHQVLIFTCHQHIAKLFRTVKADVRNLPDRRGSLEVAPPRREPQRPEPAPEPEPAPVVQPAAQPVSEPVEEVEPVEVQPEPVVEVVALEPDEVEEAEVEVVEAESELFVEVEEAEVIEPPPPPPKPAPRRKARRRRVIRHLERQRWNAEEFEGELADRVRHDLWIEEEFEPELADEHAA